jgi:hypothetical protein
MVYQQTKLRNWINKENLKWDYLSENTNAIEIIKEKYDKIDWYSLSGNPTAIDILKDNLEKNKKIDKIRVLTNLKLMYNYFKYYFNNLIC